jgi:DNA-binding transcriptional LysR family regulator
VRAVPIDALRAFVAVVETRGFTRAAKALGRTQPTISLQVKRLEEILQAPLFDDNSQLSLTREGDICLRYARDILKFHDEMMRSIDRLGSKDTFMRVGLSPEFVDAMIPVIVNTNKNNKKDTSIDIVIGDSPAILTRLGDYTIDVALTVSKDRAGNDHLKDTIVKHWRLPLYWVGAPGVENQIEQVLEIVLPPEPSILNEIVTDTLRRHDRKYIVTCSSMDAGVLKAAALSGIGIAAYPKGFVPSGLKRVSSSSLPPLPMIELELRAKPDAHSNRTDDVVDAVRRRVNRLSTAPDE